MTQPDTDTPKTYKQLLADLTPKQKKFVREYVREPNGAKAAIAAGYSEDSARQIASENLTKPNIAAAVEAGFEQVMGRNEVRARTAEVAAGSMEDFLTIERVPYLEPVHLPAEEAIDLLNDTIAELSEELDSAKEDRSDWITKELRRLNRAVRKCERALAKADPEEGDPEVSIEAEWKERVVVRIDLEKAKNAGKLHLVKKLKETKFGLEIELHDAAAARELLGKHYRLWGDRLALENPDGSPLPIKFIVGIPQDAL
ncbi:hypothetical protein GO986_16140 [Deinococcus sp. HMF7620]|uniref:Terminase small subunit n=1 Tax=Deinococcus arboris TaxID=2682977 RepID=A0A7C9LQ45_9DEIO|nr:terminase small subunit [Deinococcus arboris]MVN88276.1 hypothetical protein [Deinococcus arboris]